MMSGDLMTAQRAKCERCSVYVSFDPPGLPTCAGHTLSVSTLPRAYKASARCQSRQHWSEASMEKEIQR
jgi:hypothetical protein